MLLNSKANVSTAMLATIGVQRRPTHIRDNQSNIEDYRIQRSYGDDRL